MTDIKVRVVDCWVFRRDSDGLQFLIMRRAPSLLYEGMYHCVHGKIEASEPAWQAAIRELREETGFKPVKMWTADHTSQFYDAANDTFNLIPVFACEVNQKEVRLSHEHDRYEWLSPSEAEKRVAWENHKKAIRRISEMFMGNFPEKRWLEISL